MAVQYNPNNPFNVGVQGTGAFNSEAAVKAASSGAKPSPVSMPPVPLSMGTATPSSTPQSASPVAVVTSQQATQDYNEKQQGYNNVVAGVQAQSQANDVFSQAAKNLPNLNTLKEGETVSLPTGTYQKMPDGSFQLIQGQASGDTGSKTLSENDIANALSSGETTDTTGATDTTGQSAYETQVGSLQKQADEAFAKYQKDIESIRNGTFPLTADQQAQINSIQATFNRLIEEQKITNKNYEGGITQAGIASGRNRYAPELELGNIANAVNVGIQKIADIEQKAVSTLSELREAFQDKNYKLVNDLYSNMSGYLKDKSDTISKLHKEVVDAEKEQYARKQQEKQDAYNQVQKPINDVAAEAAKYGASPDVIKKISGAKTVGEAMQAASGYLQDPTSLGGMYTAYANTQKSSGKVPMSASEFVSAQKYADALATEKAQAAYSYQNAYNAAAAKAAVDKAYGLDAGGNKNQQKLETDYKNTLLHELSNRSGGLGLQDQKVNQALHAKNMFEQYKDVDSKGNVTYNIPASQYSELAITVANLLSGAGQASEATIESIRQATLKGDINKIITYATGSPQNGSTQKILANLLDTVDRQGGLAEDIRDQDVAFLHGLAPTDLDPDRRSALEANLLPSYKNPQQNIVQAAAQADNTVTSYITSHPEKREEMIKRITDLETEKGEPISSSDLLMAFPEYAQ